ncbi:hypothetical protein CLF_110015 [Clonorchis sinensis]|uniref:EGF-like domain-containing protein n=1 Tax=Clonorchis sinensis TaxID=79923 RepID=G7YK49_CLOSI|nr:hypothetical protein CLF_110015 [Clonorchis sinensis]
MMSPGLLAKRLQANRQARRKDKRPPNQPPMNVLELLIFRAQRMGFRRSSLPQSESNFSFWENMSADLHGIIEAYVAQARAVREGKKIPTFHEFLTKMVHGPRHDEDIFLYHLLNNATTTIFFRDKVYYEFLRGFLDENILPEHSAVYKEPLFMSVMKAWKIIHLFQISSSHEWFVKPSGAHTLVTGTLSKIHDEWSVMFIGHFCHAFRKNKLKTPTGFCPDPCLAQPCVGITGTSSSKCTPFGFSPREYDCVCQPQHQWVRPSREWPEGVIRIQEEVGNLEAYGTSERLNLNKADVEVVLSVTSGCPTEKLKRGCRKISGACVAKSRWELYCNEKGTQRRDYVEGKEICVCRESHMGPRCEKLRDPCIDTSDPHMLVGNAACNSPEGGMCFGYLGSSAYKCKSWYLSQEPEKFTGYELLLTFAISRPLFRARSPVFIVAFYSAPLSKQARKALSHTFQILYG